MTVNFNSFGLIEKPKISIHKMDLTMIGYLTYSELECTLNFTDISEVTFRVYNTCLFYDCLLKNMVIEIENIGRFLLTNIEESDEGEPVKSKSVTAQSYEVVLNKTTLSYKDNTVFKLWDAINPGTGIELSENGTVITDDNRIPQYIYQTYPTLLYIIQQETGWTIAHVDSTLLNQYRTLSIDKAECYGLLMGDIAEAFKCYFVFDTINKTISCYDREKVPYNSQINLSFKNLIRTQKISEGNDDVITALMIEGAEGVGINLVNPLGNNVVYDFSYYCNNEKWGMSSDLQTAIADWNELIESEREDYEQLVLDRRNADKDLLDLQTEMSTLESEMMALRDIQSAYISTNNEEGLAAVYIQINNKQEEIDDKQEEIDAKQEEYDTAVSGINAIVNELKLENNFTDDQLAELKCYTNMAVYENANFIYTDVMSEYDKINISQQLYEQGLKEFNKINKAKYQYECDISPFMFDPKYEVFTNNLELGRTVNLEIEDGVWAEPRILQVKINYEDTSNCTVVLSDSLTIKNGCYDFSDGWNQAVKLSRKTSLSSAKWDEPIQNGFYNTVNNYINSALDLAKQEIINATNQEFTLGSYGLRGKKYDSETETYDDHQVAMTNNVIAFTDDNWQTAKAALGKITLGETDYYGLVAEAIVGRLIAGTQLTIESGNGSFVMDGSGAKLENAPFTITNATSKILLNPTDGFKIQKKNGSAWVDVLSEDTSGNIVANSIKLNSGNIGGWTIETNQLSSPTGDYIASNGTGKLSLLTWNNSSATFSGNIYANNLNWNNGTSSVPVFTTLGTMNGSWLTNGSIDPDKRNVAEWDAIYADVGAFNKIYANFVEIKDEVVFKGKVRVGDENNYSLINSELRYTDTEHGYLMNLYFYAPAGFVFNTSLDGVGSATFNLPVSVSSNLSVTGDGSFIGDLLVSGGITTSGVSDFYDQLKLHNGIHINGYISVQLGDDIYTGVQDSTFTTSDGQTVRVINGVIVSVT